MPGQHIYRVFHLLVDWVGLTWIFIVPLFPILLRLMAIEWVRWWNTGVKFNPTQVHEQMGHPVLFCVFNFLLSFGAKFILLNVIAANTKLT